MSELMTAESRCLVPTFPVCPPAVAATTADAARLGAVGTPTPQTGLGAQLRHDKASPTGTGIGRVAARSLFVNTRTAIHQGSRSWRPPA
jgi:hypothetical protein